MDSEEAESRAEAAGDLEEDGYDGDSRKWIMIGNYKQCELSYLIISPLYFKMHIPENS